MENKITEYARIVFFTKEGTSCALNESRISTGTFLGVVKCFNVGDSMFVKFFVDKTTSPMVIGIGRAFESGGYKQGMYSLTVSAE